MKRQDRQFRITKFQGKAIAVAISALFGAMAAPAAFAINAPDGGTVVVPAADVVVFTGAAASLTGIATVADGNTLGAVTVTNNNAGTLTFLGAATGTTVGAAGNIVGLVNFNGVAGKTVALTGALLATNVTMGAGTYTSGGNITSAVNFAADGAISLTAANAVLTGAVTNTTAGQGTLTFTSTTANTTVATAAIGNTGTGLKAVNVAPATGITATFAGAVTAVTVTNSGAGTAQFNGDVTGAVSLTGSGTALVAADKKIVGTVGTGTDGTGTLTFATTTAANTVLVSGAVGGTTTGTKGLLAVNVDNGGVAVSLGSTVRASTVTLTGTGTTSVAGNINASTKVHFASDGTLAMAADTSIFGVGGLTAVTTAATNTGTLTFGTTTVTGTTALGTGGLVGTPMVNGTVGATGLLLKQVTVANGGKTVGFGGAIFATTVTLGGTGITGANDITGTSVNFTADGSLNLAANAKIAAAVDNTAAAGGTVNFSATTANTTLISGQIGATNALKAINVAPATGITATIGGGATANAVTTLTNSGAGTVALASTGTHTGAIRISGGGTVTGAGAITGTVDNTGTAATGTLTMAAGKGVSGAIGTTAALATVNADSTGGVTFGGIVKATNFNLAGTGTATLNGDVTGAVNLNADGTASVAADKKIVGTVTTATDNTGTLTFGTSTANTTLASGAIGTSTKALKVLNIDTGALTDTLGGDVFAKSVKLTGTGTLTASGNITGAVNFENGNGTISVADGKSIVGAVTNTTANQGKLNFLGGTTTGGDIGVTGGGKLNAVTFNAGAVSIGHNITSDTIVFGGTSTSTFTAAKTLVAAGGVTTAAGATLDVGTVGTTITGNFTTVAGTTLKTSLISATTTGALTVSGTGTVVAGTKVFVNVGSIAVVDGQKFKLVNSGAGAGATDLTAGNVTTNSAVLSFTGKSGSDAGVLAVGAEDLFLVATRAAGGFTGVSGISSSAPGASALTALNGVALLPPAVGSDMATVVNTFNGYTAAQLLSEAPKLAPTTGAAQIGAGIGTVGQSLNVVYTRMASIRGDSSQLASGAAASGVAAGSAPGREVWVKGFGSNTSQNSYDGFSGYSGRSYGLAFGADTDVGSNTRLGLGLSYAKTNVGFSNDGSAGAGSNVSVNTYQITGYGTRDFGQAYVDGLLSYARHNTSGNRLVALARQATYSTNANQWSARIGAGYHIPMSGKTMFTPLASLEWTNFNQNAYTESGAGALSLNVDGLRVNRTKGGVGFRVSGESTMASGTVFKPELHMGVYNDFNNGTVATTSSFTGGGGSFSTNGQSVQRTSYNVGAGVTFMQGRSGSVGVVYDYESRSSFKGHNFQVQGRWAF